MSASSPYCALRRRYSLHHRAWCRRRGRRATASTAAAAATEERVLVLVRAGKQVNVVLLAIGKRDREILREQVAVDHHSGLDLEARQLGERLRTQLGDRLDAGGFQRLRAGSLGLLGGRHAAHLQPHPAAALRDRAVEETLGLWRSDERADHDGAGRLAGDGDVVRVAAERRDVLLDPLQRGDGVHHPVVAGAAVAGFLRQLGMREEPERTEPVIHRDDDGPFDREVLAVIPGLPPDPPVKPPP